VRFNEVDFGKGAQRTIEVRAKSAAKDSLEVHLDSADGPLLGVVKVRSSGDWTLAKASGKKIPAGVHDLVITHAGTGPVDVDWISFR
jgi:hypothetical protein